MSKKRTTEEFINEARRIHGEKYDYSKVQYVRADKAVCIICPIHGEFWQAPCNHLQGKEGCKKCAKRFCDRDTFIEKANRAHGNTYDYTRVVYHGSQVPVDIICPIHGVFRQKPSRHIINGCPMCAYERKRNGASKVGINDVLNAKRYYSYFIWRGMIARAFGETTKKAQPSYKEVTVCEDWLTYSKFKQWFDDPRNGYQKGYQLDKDIIRQGNTMYSPDTCCFVPREINSLLRKRIGNNHNCDGIPTGVERVGNKFVAILTANGRKSILGRFENSDDAFECYRKAKEERIHNVANKYFAEGKITKRVHDAMLKYSITKYG